MEPNFLVDVVNVGSSRIGGDKPRLVGGSRLAQDLRKDPRVPVRQMIVDLPAGERAVTGNVSVGGIGFELDERPGLAPGQIFGVRLTVPDSEPLDIRAALCHLQPVGSSGRYYAGARFVDLDELSECPLFRYIEEATLAVLANAVVQ